MQRLLPGTRPSGKDPVEASVQAERMKEEGLEVHAGGHRDSHSASACCRHARRRLSSPHNCECSSAALNVFILVSDQAGR